MIQMLYRYAWGRATFSIQGGSLRPDPVHNKTLQVAFRDASHPATLESMKRRFECIANAITDARNQIADSTHSSCIAHGSRRNLKDADMTDKFFDKLASLRDINVDSIEFAEETFSFFSRSFDASEELGALDSEQWMCKEVASFWYNQVSNYLALHSGYIIAVHPTIS
jgi:hypothetical protein